MSIMVKTFLGGGQKVDRASTREIVYRLKFDRSVPSRKDIADTMAMARFLKGEGRIKRVPQPDGHIDMTFAKKAEKTVK